MDQSTLNPEQLDGVTKFNAFMSDPTKKMLAISGPAGVGKTYLTKFLLQMLPQLDKLKKLIDETHVETEFLLLANTTKAARSLSDATGLNAHTVHSGLGLKPDYTKSKQNDLVFVTTRVTRNKLIFIDEAFSMTKELIELIDTACKDCKFVMIGDEWQLPPINEKHSSLVNSADFFIDLITPMRQTAGTPLQLLCEDLRQAVINSTFPEIKPNGLDIIQIDDKDLFEEMISDEFIKAGPLGDKTKVLAYTNPTIRRYNRKISKALGITQEFQVGTQYVINSLFRSSQGKLVPPESVMLITQVSPTTLKKDHSGYMVTGTVDGRQVTGFVPDNAPSYRKTLLGVERLEILSLRLNFALTIHKAQGSTYDTVFIDTADIMDNCYDASTLLRLLSVGVSRARTKVVLYGS